MAHLGVGAVEHRRDSIRGGGRAGEALPAIIVGRRDVVPNAQHAGGLLGVHCVEHLARHPPRELRSVRHGVAGAVVGGRRVAQVIVPGERRRLAPRGPRVPPAGLDPQAVVDGRLAQADVVRPALVGVLVLELQARARVSIVRLVAALAVVAHVLRIRLVVAAARQVVGENGNVPPGRWVPVSEGRMRA
jgi:hypothetical protein